jgi:hypothetical protein
MEWSELKPEGDVPSAREGHAMVEYKGALYLFGGTDANSNFQEMYRYDVDVNRWELVPQRGDVPSGRAYFSWVSRGGQAWCIYGSAWYSYQGDICDDVLQFDFETLTWLRCTWSNPDLREIPTPRFAHTAARVGDHILLYGGWNIIGNVPVYHDDLFCLDLRTSPFHNCDHHHWR